MHFFERILNSFGFVRPSNSHLNVDSELMPLLENIAVQERKSVEEITEELLYFAITERHTAVEGLQLWGELTPREKQTAALACLGFTNQEIAENMVISTNTVKTHVRHILNKFNVSSKTELRSVLAGWDFSAWVERQNLLPEPEDTPTNGGSSNRVTP